MSDDGLTPRERAAVAAGFPHDITFGELREELTRAWAIVDAQSKPPPGYLLVSEAELATALGEAWTDPDGDDWIDEVGQLIAHIAARDIFAALVAAQEKGT